MAKSDGETRIRDWYHENYPTDDLWAEIDEGVDFYALYCALNEHRDVYECIFGSTMGGDSIVRERCFTELASIMGCDYDVIYYQWLGKPQPKAQKEDDGERLPEVGDIWYSSWGYEQTNIDWYQVTKASKCNVWLTPIKGTRKDDGFMSGTTVPLPNEFCGKEKRHKFKKYSKAYCCSLTSYSSAFEWDGKPKRYSYYG